MALATLSIDLVAKIAQFEEDMGRAARAAEAQASRVERAFGGAAKAIAGLGIAALVTERLNSIKVAIDKLDALDDLSEKYGVAASKLSAYSYASEVAGTSTEAFADGLNKLSKNMAAAAGGSVVQISAFKAVGVAVKDANGNLRSADEVLLDLADRFASYEDGAAKAAIAQAIFGKSGAELIPVLNRGRDGIKDLTEEARLFGLVVDDKAAKAAGDFNDNLTRLRLSTDSLKIALASDLLPTLVRFTNELLEGRKAFGGWLAAAEQLGLRTNPFATYEESAAAAGRRVGELREALQNVQDRARRGRGTDADRQFVDLTNAELDTQERRLKYFRRMAELTTVVPEGMKDTRGGDGKAPAPIIDSKAQSSADAMARKLEAVRHAYAKLMESVAARGALAAAELDNNAKLSEADRYRIEQLAKLNAAESQFSAAQKAAGKVEVDRVAGLIAQIEVRAQLRAAAEADSAAEQGRIADIEAAIEARIGENRALSEQAALFGATAEQIDRASIARLRDTLAVEQAELAAKAAAGAGAGEIDLLRSKIALLERQIGLRTTLADIADREAKDPAAGLSRGLKDYLDMAERAGEATRTAAVRAVSTLEDNLTSSLAKRKLDVRSFVDTTIAEFFRLQVIRPLLQSVFGGGGAGGFIAGALKFLGFAGSANGDIFDLGSAKPFAAGAVFNSPRFFRYANGGVMNLGLMAEAGPEAVMPLKRNSAGQLGVLVANRRSDAQASARGMPDIHIINEGPPIQQVEARMSDGQIVLRIAAAAQEAHDRAVRTVTAQMGDANTKLRGTLAGSVQAPRIAR